MPFVAILKTPLYESIKLENYNHIAMVFGAVDTKYSFVSLAFPSFFAHSRGEALCV
jgi:hypothetical protein